MRRPRNTLQGTDAEHFCNLLTRTLLEDLDFEAQRRIFTYSERPYEIAAKQLATDILGYNPTDYEVFLLREEPSSPLYDDKPPQTI